MISAGRQTRRDDSMKLVARVALLFPGIAVHVISEGLPEAWLVLGNEGQATHPFRALPEVQVRNDEASWAAVSGCQRRVIELGRNQRPTVHQIGYRQICRITSVGVRHHI